MLGDSVRRRNPGQKARSRPPRTPREGPRLRWKLWAPILLAAAIVPFAIGYVMAVRLLFPPLEVVGEGIVVPALRGESEAQARQTLAAAGLGAIDARPLPHPDFPEGTIVAQSPLPGQQLRAGSPVRVAVSSGVARVVVPDVVGFQVERARGLLERLGFSVVEEEQESEAARGRTIGMEPNPGSRMPLPATVRLTVSAGPPALPADTGVVRTDTLARAPGTSR